MATKDWSRFSRKIYINAPIQDVYSAWTTRTNLEKWFLRKAEFSMPNGEVRADDSPVAAGDTYSWLWHGYPDTTAERGRVLDANGTSLFRFLFGTAGLVTVKLTRAGEMTEVLLTQENIPTDDDGKMNYHVGCSVGWTFYLANIKSVLETGYDLRNKSLEYTNVINS